MINNDKKVIIRMIKQSEIITRKKEIIKMINENYDKSFPQKGDLTNASKKSYESMKTFLLNDSAYVLLALLNSEVVGFLWAYERVVLNERKIHINHIVVKAGYRNKGIGTSMIEYIENISYKKGIENIELMATVENKEALKFYEKQGYHVGRLQLEKKLGGWNANKQKTN